MLEAFEKRIRDVRLRCSVNLLVEQAARALITAGTIGALAVLIERLFSVNVIDKWFVALLSVICLAGIGLVYMVKQPSRMHAALLIDERLELKERFSTTIMTANSEDPFARAAQKEARKKASVVRINESFPFEFSNRWYYAFGAWAVMFAIVIFLPPQDLLGFARRQEERDKEYAKKQAEQVAIKEATKPVQLVVKQLGDEGLSTELAKLEPLMNNDMPEDAKRQTIRKLGDISDQIKKLQEGTKMEANEIARQMLKQLKGSPQGLAQELGKELAKGNFSKASDMLKQLQEKLDEGELSEEQKKQLEKQLKDLSEQLKALAKKNSELQKELEKMGLDKKLAQMNEDELKQALQKKGLTQEQIEKLMQKASACKSACNSCSQLGQAMAAASAGAGAGSGDQMSEIMDQLSAMEAMSQQMQMMQASIDEISRCIGCLGEGMCQGSGNGPWKAGMSNKQGNGTGGPGRGSGFRPTADGGQFKTLNTKANNKNAKPGPVVASWYFKGEQVRGDAERDYTAVVEAGKARAAEAISENQIPRKYEDTVKKYFGGLEEKGD